MAFTMNRKRTVFGRRLSPTPPLYFADDQEWLQWEQNNIAEYGDDAIKAARDRVAIAQMMGDITLQEHNEALDFVNGLVGTLRRSGC